MTQKKVGLLFGGRSGEHEVSLNSARAIWSALKVGENQQKYSVTCFYIQKNGIWSSPEQSQEVLEQGTPLPCKDLERSQLWQLPPQAAAMEVWFPVLHGPNGEDGTLQGLLTLMQVPFVGSGVLGSAVGMDKIAMKQAFAAADLPQVKYVAVTREKVWSNPCVFPALCEHIEDSLGYPCFVKPANLGSSVGIAKVRNRQELETALDQAASYDRRLIVEAGLGDIREVECAVLGNENPQVSVVGEITYKSDFYDYETKYTDGLAQLHIPADLPPQVVAEIQSLAVRAFKAKDGVGLGRLDFFYQEHSGTLVVNEINTLPGFTALSMYPQLWQASGLSFPELADKLLQLALEHHQNCAGL